MASSFRNLRGLGLAAGVWMSGVIQPSFAADPHPDLAPPPAPAPAVKEAPATTSVDNLIPGSLRTKPETQAQSNGPAPGEGSAYVGQCQACKKHASKPCCNDRKCGQCEGCLFDLFQKHYHRNGGSGDFQSYLAEKFNRDRLRGRLGYFIPEGSCGQGTPWMGHYHMGYAVNPYHFDTRDANVYAAQGYGIPISIPLAPNVEHQYNYGWGVPSSRLTPVSRYIREPGITGPAYMPGAYPIGLTPGATAHPFAGQPAGPVVAPLPLPAASADQNVNRR